MRRTEIITRQSESNQGKQPSRKQRSCLKFLGMAGDLDNYISNYAAIAAPLHQLTQKDKIQMGEKRTKRIQEDTRHHLKRQDNGIL